MNLLSSDDAQMIRACKNVIVGHNIDENGDYYLRTDNGKFIEVNIVGSQHKQKCLQMIKRFIPGNLLYKLGEKKKKYSKRAIYINPKVIFLLFDPYIPSHIQIPEISRSSKIQMLRRCEFCDTMHLSSKSNVVLLKFKSKPTYVLCCSQCFDLFLFT